MTLSIRLTLAMVALVAGTTIAILFFTNRALESIIGPRALLGVETHARLLASKLEDKIGDVKTDVLIVKSTVAMDELIRTRVGDSWIRIDGAANKPASERLAMFFKAQLATKPAYLQFSIIGVENGGHEILRVDRSGPKEAIRLVSIGDLQPRGDTDYFQDTLKLKAGEIYVSRIEYDHENNPGIAAQIPFLRVATPIHAPDGSPFGIIVIKYDMRSAFEAIRALARSTEPAIAPAKDVAGFTSSRIYVVNDRGDYLVHPDRAREFGFEFGMPNRITDDMSDVSALLGTEQPQSRMLKDKTGAGFGIAMAPVQLAKELWIGVVEAVPRAEIMAPVAAVQRASLLAGLIAMLDAVVLAVLLAKSMMKPLAQMTGALMKFKPEVPFLMPDKVVRRSGEIGILARTFEHMAIEMSTQTAWLRHESEQRERYLNQLNDLFARQNAIFANSTDGILTLNESGTIETLNPAAERMFGCTSLMLVQRDIGQLIELGEPKDISSADNLRNLLASGSAISQLIGRRNDSSTFPIEVLLTEMIVSGRKMFVMFARDITGKKIAEENFRLAVESCPSGMVMVDAAGTILLVNTETEKLFQYRREELIGQSVDILVPPRFRAKHPDHRNAYYDDPNARLMGEGRELFGLRKDGTEFPVEIGLNPIRRRDGSTVILSAIIDISERKRHEQLKDEFVAMVSHELRTPLTSISASLGLLVADSTSKLSDAASRLLRIAHSNSQRLVRLINDILDIEKIESGKIEFDMRRFEIRPLVEQAIESNRGFASQFDVNVRLDPASADVVVRADVDRLTQVIVNLLSNAVKYSPRGGEVLVTIANIGKLARIAVRDHGPGIPEEFRSRIFERFAQADNSDARQKGGTGLGLSIVKQIVNKLGGETGFDAAPGGGTMFYIDLPQHGTETVAEPGRADGMQILLCEDDPGAAVALCDQLREAGFNPAVAYTAEEAVRGAATRPYAAILVDLQLPDSDGITLIKQLRSQWYYQNTPIIVVSADPTRGREDARASTLNVLDWLSKPVDIERLTRILNRPLVRDPHPRPCILHVDDDQDVLRLVADALKASADVSSVDSLEKARRALAERVFDLAIIDVALADGKFGLDLLPDLLDKAGQPIPVVVFSAQDMTEIGARVFAALTKSRASIDSLIAILRRLVADRPLQTHMIKEVA